MSERDKLYLAGTMEEVCKRNPGLNPMTLDFMRRLLLMDFQPYLSDEQRDERLKFVMRWQQFSGP